MRCAWAPEGKRKRGRPKERWRRTVEKERIMAMGFNSWVEAGLAAILSIRREGNDGYTLSIGVWNLDRNHLQQNFRRTFQAESVCKET